MNLRLIERHSETNGVLTFTFEPEQPMVWQAGQYLHYTLRHDQEDDRGSERWFTIAAPPFERRPRITTRLAAESSSFKQALGRLPLGGVIEADGPEGDFVVDDPEHDYVFIAGGIGITPFRAILLQLDHDRVRLVAVGFKRG